MKTAGYDEDIDIGHGQIETRKCTVITDLVHIEEPQRWKNLNVFVRMDSKTYFKTTGKIEKSIQYYIGRKTADAAFYQKGIRGHWAIKNKLHLTLDVVF